MVPAPCRPRRKRRNPAWSCGQAGRFRAATDGGSRITYRLSAAPHGVVGHVLFATGMLDKIGKGLEEMVQHAAAFVRGEAGQPFAYTPPPANPEQRLRLATLARQVSATPYAHGLEGKLAEHIETAQEVDLVRIRPRKLAREWQALR